MFNTITLFVSVGLEEGVRPDEVKFTVYENELEEDGFVVYRNGDQDGEMKIHTPNTWILGRNRDQINFDEHDLILEIEVPVDERVSPEEVTFTVDSAEVDGFEINVGRKPNSFEDESIIDADETYIRSRFEKAEKPQKNKVFVAYFKGHYMPGSAVATAPDLDTAYQMIKRELEAEGLDEKFKKNDIVEVDTKRQNVEILTNGNH